MPEEKNKPLNNKAKQLAYQYEMARLLLDVDEKIYDLSPSQLIEHLQETIRNNRVHADMCAYTISRLEDLKDVSF